MRAARRAASTQRWLLGILAFVVLAAGLGLRAPWPADEPRFALIARDMALGGEWLFPEVAGVVYADKPPLGMWTMAAGHRLGVPLSVAFLLPSLLAALGTLVLVYDLGRRLWSHRVGLYAAVLLLVTLQFGLQAKSAQLDAQLAFWTTLAVYGLARHTLVAPHWGWYTLGGLAAGLGVLTKGVGIIALFALLPVLLARRGDWRHGVHAPAPAWRWALAPLAAVAVVAAWAIPMSLIAQASGDANLLAYRDEILFHQTATRYAQPWAHVQPWWYFLVNIPLFWLPAALLLPWAVPAWRRRLARRDARYLVLLGTVSLMFLFFQGSSAKRGVYLLPLLPLFCLALAPLLPGLLRRRAVQHSALAALALLSAAALGFVVWHQVLAPARGAALVAKHGVTPWPLLWAIAVLGLAWLIWGWRRRQGLVALSGWLATLWLLWGGLAYPLLDGARSGRDFMQRVASALPGPAAELGLVDWEEQFVLQAARPVVHFGFRRGGQPDEVADGLAWLLAGIDRHLLVPRRDLGECVDATRVQDLGHESRRDWVLVSVAAIRAECIGTLGARPVTALAAPHRVQP